MPDDAAGAARVLVRTFRGEVVDANVHAISLPWWVGEVAMEDVDCISIIYMPRKWPPA